MKRRTQFLVVFVVLVLFVSANWMIFSKIYKPLNGSKSTKNWAEIEAGLSKYHNKYYDQDEMYFMAVGWPLLVEAAEKISLVHVKQAEQGWLTSPEQPWNVLSESSPHRAIENMVASRSSIIDSSFLWKHYWDDCWNDRSALNHTNSPRVSYFRLSADPICTFLWMLKLRQEPIEDIDKVLAVVTRADEKLMGREDKPQQNGGMRTQLSSGMHAYWKPCTKASGNGESYLPEIMAFHIDRIVQFNRAPAVVPRYISATDFYELSRRAEHADPDIERKVKSILRNCGQENEIGAEGSFVGWSPFGVELLRNSLRRIVTPRIGELNEIELKHLGERMEGIHRDSPPEDIEWAMELVTGHMFGILIGTLSRFKHNQHFFLNPETFKRGPMIYIDNDRAQWDHVPHDISHGNGLQKFCRFPEKLSKRIMMLAGTGIVLGDVLMKISDIYKDSMKEGPLFTESMKRHLQSNIKWLANSIYECIKRHGEETVLIPEHWESSAYDNFNLMGKTTFFDFLQSLSSNLDI